MRWDVGRTALRAGGQKIIRGLFRRAVQGTFRHGQRRTPLRTDGRRRDPGARAPHLLHRRGWVARPRRAYRSGDLRRGAGRPAHRHRGAVALVRGLRGQQRAVRQLGDGHPDPRAVRRTVGLLRGVRRADGRADAGQAHPSAARRARRWLLGDVRRVRGAQPGSHPRHAAGLLLSRRAGQPADDQTRPAPRRSRGGGRPRARGVSSRDETGAGRERQALIAANAPRWQRFGAQLATAQKRGLRSLGEDGVREFVAEYRALAADLARLRTASGGRAVDEVFSLGRLVAGAHNLLYRDRGMPLRAAIRFLFTDVPREIRRSAPPIVLAALLLFGPALVTAVAVARTPGLAKGMPAPRMPPP